MGKSVKINITLPEEILSEIDQYIREEKTTRSGLILKSLQFFVKKEKEALAAERRRMEIQKAASEIRKMRSKAGDWNGVAEIRKWRDAR